jgi:glycosyltransferase involved in cell wall biosynthesis
MGVNVFYRPQSFGGATLLLESLTRLLHARSDTRVSIFTTAPAGWLKPHELERSHEEGVPVIRIGIQDRPGWHEEWWDEAAGESFREALRALRPDVVHFHAMQGFGAVLLEICKEENVPFVVTLHDAWWLCRRQFLVTAEGRYCGQERVNLNVCASCAPNPDTTAFRALRLRRALSEADELLAPSEHWRRFYINNGFAPDYITTNENGIRRPTTPKPNLRPARLRFGFVAGTEVVKGFPLVKQAFEALKRDDWELVLVNHGLSIGHDAFAGIDWQVRGSIRMVPPYTLERADIFYDSIDVLLFPSQCPESFGLTVREALARNKWVIATDHGGAAEAIIPGENGTLIPVGDVGSLQSAVEALLDGMPDLHGWVNPYADRIRSIETQAEELRNIIERVVSQRFATAGQN